MILYNDNVKKSITVDNPWFKQARELYIRVFKDSEAFCDVVLNNAKALSIEMYESKVVACAFIREKQIKVKGTTIKVAFMFGVATDEKYRNKGYSRRVIENVFEHLKSEYEYLLLCPANFGLYSFYSKFGFEPLTYFSYLKGDVMVNEGTVVQGSIKDVEKVYEIFMLNSEHLDTTQQRSLSQIQTRLKELFADKGELFFVEKDSKKVGYFLLEDKKYITEHVNAEIKYANSGEYIVVCSSTELKEENKCPGVVIKALNGKSIDNICGIIFYEMW